MRTSCMPTFEGKGQLSAYIKKVIFTLSPASNLGNFAPTGTISHGC